ncbi:MAG: HAD-IG family 5'-nucleotidase [Spirochaetales bacterium]|nr:HAD-IG family 5'-nucleotidase [Spirochaetales bacterium]
MSVFVNRVLNLKKIKVIGFDMDYTLVRYHTGEFEKLAHRQACNHLVDAMGYPAVIRALKFDMDRSIGGLVIDKRNGNLLKLSRYSKVKTSYHGLDEIDYKTQTRIYREMAIDLNSPEFKSLDTAFAISNGVLYSQLVDLKKKGSDLPDYSQLSEDVDNAVDAVHQNGSLKSAVKAEFGKYVIQDPKVAWLLERYKDYNKKLVIITNSDFAYSRALLEYSLDPFWKKHRSWTEVFDIVITLADKPRFFERQNRFLSIDPASALMSNHFGSVSSGIFQGGWFRKLQDDLGVPGSEILYFGDHIYGDVVSIKKQCNWRTALVLEDLEREIEGNRRSHKIQEKIDVLMARKKKLEKKLNDLDIRKYEGFPVKREQIDDLYNRLDEMNSEISELIEAHKKFYNPYWGEVLRAGNEESRFADQVERYACLYMTRVSDLYYFSPRTYFRPERRIMPHEINEE